MAVCLTHLLGLNKTPAFVILVLTDKSKSITNNLHMKHLFK